MKKKKKKIENSIYIYTTKCNISLTKTMYRNLKYSLVFRFAILQYTVKFCKKMISFLGEKIKNKNVYREKQRYIN